MINLKSVGKKFGPAWVFRNVDLTVKEGQCVALLGHSGCGKSTILRCCMGFENFSEGICTMFNETFPPANPVEILKTRKKVGFLAQGLNLWPYRTVVQNIADSRVVVDGIPRELANEEAHQWLVRLKLQTHAGKYPHEISGGEQQRVALARCLIRKPKLLLLDEPTSGLDPLNASVISELIINLKHEGFTILITSHQIDLLRRVSDYSYFIHGQTVWEQGASSDVLAQPATPELAQFIERIRLGW